LVIEENIWAHAVRLEARGKERIGDRKREKISRFEDQRGTI